MKKLSMILALLLLLSPGLPALAAEGAAPVRVMGLIGPTGMSLAPMIAKADPAYQFSLAAAPEELVGSIVSGNYDIAAVPTNMAALLYQRTKGELQLLAINTLGVLYVLEKGEAVHKAQDLAGKTLTMAGQGAVPEYAINFIAQALGIDGLTLDFKSEHNEVNTLAAAGQADLVMLPQPMATALMMKDAGFRVALDVTEVFAEAARQADKPEAVLSMGCLVVRKAFAKEQPEAVQAFLAQYEESVAFVNDQPELAAKDIVAAGILPNEKIAVKAIPLCHIVYVVGEDMQRQLAPLFQILFDAQPKSVGGALPDEAFYYLPK